MRHLNPRIPAVVLICAMFTGCGPRQPVNRVITMGGGAFSTGKETVLHSSFNGKLVYLIQVHGGTGERSSTHEKGSYSGKVFMPNGRELSYTITMDEHEPVAIIIAGKTLDLSQGLDIQYLEDGTIVQGHIRFVRIEEADGQATIIREAPSNKPDAGDGRPRA